ncbi:TetR/AcrR family transcriptional regulator [Pseudorhizobium endolithicum]|uniref:TetR/AcrR family transcriptional regulator n=1 Tax=Pseudorhizobium endolithicum TaxID=1191678 RepID=A0ABN7JR54_9HYPH|nr:TetR family transcriptional regulator [Pseudorhizobium endolithicum]CAD7036998.1 TetR/AcrR family transcriptional regulator [Pseudorhizobium endolithicum]
MKDAEATRERLIAAARTMFAKRGYEGTTVREIAGEARVNPALINRYFGGKEKLFAEAVSISLDLPNLKDVERGVIGRRLVEHFFTRWEGSKRDDLLRVLVRTAVTNDEAAARMRTILFTQVAAMVEQVTGPDRAKERAGLIATQILGLAYARNVLALSDRELARDTVIVMIGDTIQRYLVEELP